MLVEFRVKNFRSLRDEQVLSLVASKDRTFEDTHILKTGVKAAPVTPVASAHFRAVGLQSIETLRAVIDALPSNPALAGGTQTDGKPPAGAEGAAVLSALDKEICRAMNLSEESYAKTKKAEA